MSRLIDRVASGGGSAQSKDAWAKKVIALTAAELHDPRLSRIYLSELSEVPDQIKNLPKGAQRVYIAVFNALLKNLGRDWIGYCMTTAAKRAREAAQMIAAGKVLAPCPMD